MPVVNGNTGEFYALTTDEAYTMERDVAGLVNNRTPLLARVGRSIRDACILAEVSAEAGASALMIHNFIKGPVKNFQFSPNGGTSSANEVDLKFYWVGNPR